MRLRRIDGTPHLIGYERQVHELGKELEHQKSEDELFEETEGGSLVEEAVASVRGCGKDIASMASMDGLILTGKREYT
jgi:hypothetical protein